MFVSMSNGYNCMFACSFGNMVKDDKYIDSVYL